MNPKLVRIHWKFHKLLGRIKRKRRVLKNFGWLNTKLKTFKNVITTSSVYSDIIDTNVLHLRVETSFQTPQTEYAVKKL